MYGYKLHICSTGTLIVPLSSGITTVNITDNQMYELLTSPLTNKIKNITADLIYRDGKLYQYNKENNLRLFYLIKNMILRRQMD